MAGLARCPNQARAGKNWTLTSLEGTSAGYYDESNCRITHSHRTKPTVRLAPPHPDDVFGWFCVANHGVRDACRASEADTRIRSPSLDCRRPITEDTSGGFRER